MHASSSTEPASPLYSAQQRVAIYRRWLPPADSTTRADRQAAEEGVRLAYQAAGMRPPGRIVWCNGPLDAAQSWARDRLTWRKSGPAVRDQIGDELIRRVTRVVQDKLVPRVWFEAVETMRKATSAVDGAEIDQAFRTAVMAARQPTWAYVLRGSSALARLENPMRTWPTIERCAFRPVTLDWLGLAHFLRETQAVAQETEPLRGLWSLAAHVGWVLAHRDCCWLVERPSDIRRDTARRLHSADGPALQFADGWSGYFWKGIRVRQEYIEDPQGITLQTIEGQRDIFVRRCMIEILTPQRFISMGGARKVHQDQTGTLWRRRWFDGDNWSAVEVVNATAEADGSFQRYFLQVPPECHTACEAVAWTYGMSEHQYARLTVRT